MLLATELTTWSTTVIVELGAVDRRAIDVMTDFLHPAVAIVTGTGPSRLDSFGTVESAEEAVWVPAEDAATVVVNVDDAALARRSRNLGSFSQTVVRVGRGDQCAVSVEPVGEVEWSVRVNGTELGTMRALPGGHTSAVACAVAGALALGQGSDVIAGRLSTLTSRAAQSTTTTTPGGLTVIVDLQCSTPAEATMSLRALRLLSTDGRKVVVTPGLINLGTAQGFENYRLGALVAQAGAGLVAIARTNAEALLDGYGGPAQRVDTRAEGVTWVRENLHAGDVVMYLNDLPDHYP